MSFLKPSSSLSNPICAAGSLDEKMGYTVLSSILMSYFPNGIDDNVGGKMLEAVLNHVNKNAKIPLCGMISGYNKEVNMQGFMVVSCLHRFGDFAKEMESHLKQGKIGSKLKIFHGIETFLESLGSLFTSSNVGKVVVQSSNNI
ncbi:hypothetical protein ACE6H2_011748 [Prunus campanulata]